MTDRRPRVGDYVTLADGQIAYVGATAVQVRENIRKVGMPWIVVSDVDRILREEDRGLTWALGTEGEEVEALRVAQALR
jgi:hypothetical protein